MEPTNVQSSSPYTIHLACAVDKFLHGLPPGDFPSACDRCGVVLDPQGPALLTIWPTASTVASSGSKLMSTWCGLFATSWWKGATRRLAPAGYPQHPDPGASA
eukprot:762922-Hanusia_phi.AAC.1